MNKDDIKKALECCRNWCPIGDCPYYGIKDCENNLFKDTIELITEQDKEIEQLKTNISQAQDQILATAQKNQEYCEQQIKQAKQQTAREILQELWCKRMAFTDLQFTICYLMAQYDIELEDENND